MTDQPELIEGVRVSLPKCYDEVVELMENARENTLPEVRIDDWPPERLAEDMKDCAVMDEDWELSDIIKAIKIWRERNA